MALECADLWDAVALYHALARAGVFEDPFRFHRFSQIVERVLWQESISIDAGAMLAEAELILTKLGVMPSGESAPTGVH
ncbi:MAG TPA: hypothetical protein VFO91_20155 [Anaerolineales bacterium]|nr:hypothetical protein [Anaerolineales bacterium]